MAISKLTYAVTRSAWREGLLPNTGTILEFGEANWYGDLAPETLAQDIESLVEAADKRRQLQARLADALDLEAEARAFALAKVFYALFFDPTRVTAIDFNGTKDSLKLDLNGPLSLDEQFDITINNGTAEHIFNLGQFFTTMHQTTKPGGLMIHEGPLIAGWVDHGFVNFQPTLFFDMAAANGYRIMSFCLGSIQPFHLRAFNSREETLAFAAAGDMPANPVFMVILRKGPTEADFRFPIQGIYANSISEEARAAWKKLR